MAPNSISEDNHVNNPIPKVQEKPFKAQIVWRNVFGMTVIHILAVYGFYLGAIGYGEWKGFLYMWVLNFLGAFSILAGAHRLWAHRTYKAKWPLRLFLMIFQTMAMQNDIYEWCRDHRVHHKYSETDADPHNSNRGFFFAHMGWLLVKKHPDVKVKGKNVDMSDLWADPIVRYQRRFYIPLIIILRGFIFMGIPMHYWHVPLWQALPANMFCYCMTLHHTWLVNSAAHMFGNKPYDMTINPRENIKVVYLTMGEGYHNYHHTFPYDYSASEFGWRDNFNPATAFIEFMAHIGQAYDLRTPSPELVKKRIERTGDGSEVIRQRYQFNYWLDLMFGLLTITWPLWLMFILRFFTAKDVYQSV